MANDWDDVSDFFTDEFTTPVVYSGLTLSGILYVSQADRLAIAAGLQSQFSQRVMLQVDECTEAGWTPTADDSVTVDDTARYVVDVQKDSTGKCYILEVQEATARG